MSPTTRFPAAIVGGLALALAVFGSCDASEQPVATKVAAISETQAQPALSVESTDDMTNCSRARRRLWVDGEGWIVRRITTCR